jgi:P pilus assembly chaperone PapD
MSVRLVLVLMLSLKLWLTAGQISAQADGAETLPGAIAISPQNHFIALDEGPQTHAYRLQNLGNLPIRVRVRVAGFELGEDFSMRLLERDPWGLAEQTIVNPVELEIPPGESRALRFSIRPRVMPPPGEYRLALVVDQVPESTSDPEPSEGMHGLVIRMQFRLLSAIYATVGSPVRRGSLLEAALVPEGLRTLIRNEGEAHIRPRGKFLLEALDGSGRRFEGTLSGLPILAGETRWVPHPLAEQERLESGRYRLRIEGTLGEASLGGSWDIELRAGTGGGSGMGGR